jgi:thiol-disulfide isomerase/thioredoxin
MADRRNPTPGALFIYAAVTCVLFFLSFGTVTTGYEKTIIYFFWSEGCPHCRKEKIFLDGLIREFPGLEVESREVRKNGANAVFFSELAGAYGIRVKGVPITFIGDFPPVEGYVSDEVTGKKIREYAQDCLENGCIDPLEKVQSSKGPLIALPGGAIPGKEAGLCGQDEECSEEEKPEKDSGGFDVGNGGVHGDSYTPEGTDSEIENVINIPFVGDIDVLRVALPYQTIIIAGLDGFNPCAFFVLFTLLGLLIYADSRKKLLLIGGIFVFFSGLIYFIFMAAWLNIFLIAGPIEVVTKAAGLVALVIAGVNIKDFFFFKKGFSLVIPERFKPKLFDRMRRLLKASSLPSVIMGTVVLAIAANAYELFCTAGFPMIYTRILTLHKLSTPGYYSYLIFYNFVYVIPLATIVVIFAITLGSRKLSERQGQVLKLVSGMMMLFLGAIIILDPGLLNNPAVPAGMLAAALISSSVISALVKRHREL